MGEQKERVVLYKSKHEDHHYLGFHHSKKSSRRRTPLPRRIFGMSVNASRKVTKIYASLKIVFNQNNYS